ncbi:MAG TPA: FAD-binding protein [Hyphomicrobiaceae bacterium]|nr:FAD-binding protein [Hyphomicrobiaceae bacterium]
MAVLLLAEHTNDALNSATAKAMTAATQLGSDVHVLVVGSNCRPAAEAASKLTGAAKVLVADAPHLTAQVAEDVAALIVGMMPGYDAVVAASTARGKNTLPRIAALLDVMQISDIIAIKSPDTFERPIYAGNAIQTVQSTDAKKVITVRTASFAAAEEGGAASIEDVAAGEAAGLTTFEKAELAQSDRPELAAARIIISGGRGLQSGENFTKYIEPVADRLGAAVGASRAAVDAGYVPNDYQVGQTGKVVAPELYIAVGISGAIQHLAGMKDSTVIVAINKDGEAPIFQVADYGLVGDLFEILPQLEAELAKNAG